MTSLYTVGTGISRIVFMKNKNATSELKQGKNGRLKLFKDGVYG